MNQTLHTPEGVRDIYQKECRKKLELERKLHQAAALYGYQDIQTPMFEYADVFQKDVGTVPSKEQYKFFDREGEIYCRYGLKHFAGRLIYLKEGKLIEVHNLLTNEQQTITADEE